MGKRLHAEVAELADAQDLKSCDPSGRAGSLPALGTRFCWVYGLTQVTESRAIFAIVPEIVPATRELEPTQGSTTSDHRGHATSRSCIVMRGSELPDGIP